MNKGDNQQYFCDFIINVFLYHARYLCKHFNQRLKSCKSKLYLLFYTLHCFYFGLKYMLILMKSFFKKATFVDLYHKKVYVLSIFYFQHCLHVPCRVELLINLFIRNDNINIQFIKKAHLVYDFVCTISL